MTVPITPASPVSPLHFGDAKGTIRRQPSGGVAIAPTYLYWSGSEWLPADLAAGVVAYWPRTTDLLSQGAEQQLLWTPWVPDRKRAYTVEASAVLGVDVADSQVQLTLRIKEGVVSAPALGTNQADLARTGSLHSTGVNGANRVTVKRYYRPGELPGTTGGVAISMTASRVAGSGAWSLWADPSYPAYIKIRDEGIPPSGFFV